MYVRWRVGPLRALSDWHRRRAGKVGRITAGRLTEAPEDLPPGLSYDPLTGQITGNADAGQYSVTPVLPPSFPPAAS